MPPTSPSFVRYHDVTSADGTRLRAWTNGAEGPTVLLSNGPAPIRTPGRRCCSPTAASTSSRRTTRRRRVGASRR
ncbi:hypothetical protein ACHMWU_15930 [Aeromicrobium sp. UC242_57]